MKARSRFEPRGERHCEPAKLPRQRSLRRPSLTRRSRSHAIARPAGSTYGPAAWFQRHTSGRAALRPALVCPDTAIASGKSTGRSPMSNSIALLPKRKSSCPGSEKGSLTSLGWTKGVLFVLPTLALRYGRFVKRDVLM